MSDRWTSWASFPLNHRDAIQAPARPGVYEICNIATRDQMAFGYARNVATALRQVIEPTGLRKWLSFRRGPRYAPGEVEYRVWPTATLADAKGVIGVIRGHRKSVLRRFTAVRA
jgi:hypothetical protein